MLAYLTVRNFALVAELELEFTTGLTVITGESGAGKSILLNALGMVLGQRTSKSQIRPGADAFEVTAEFDLSGAPVARAYLASKDLIEKGDVNQCLVRRRATPDGRSRAWINAVQVNVGELRELCASLVEIHGQFEQQQLMSPTVQLRWLDDFVADSDLTDAVAKAFNSWREAENEFEALKNSLDSSVAHRQSLQFDVKELDDFDLAESEFEDLSVRFKRISQTESILQTLNSCLVSLDEVGTPAIGNARIAINSVDDTHSDLVSAQAMLEGAEVSLEEALVALRKYAETLSIDRDSAEQVVTRIDAVHDLARKHRVQAAQLYRKWQELKAELAQLETVDEDLSVADATRESSLDRYRKHARILSNKRREASKPFCDAVLSTLADIGMADCAFEIRFQDHESAYGLEQLEYLVSANSRYAPGPLKAIASGGELSRIGLAILVVVAARSQLPCLVLDEADIGVGGTTADDVGRMLRQLATHTQLICVTHAPQVAALGDAHLGVKKSDTQDIAVESLSNEFRIEEIARMVGGQEINEESRQYAAVLLKDAQE